MARLAPNMRIMMLGGDHSVSWPVMDAMLAKEPDGNADVGIVHFDAHTDLLPQRLGVPYCFATWAFHANERTGMCPRHSHQKNPFISLSARQGIAKRLHMLEVGRVGSGCDSCALRFYGLESGCVCVEVLGAYARDFTCWRSLGG